MQSYFENKEKERIENKKGNYDRERGINWH